MVELSQEEYDQLQKDLADSRAASESLKAQLVAKAPGTPNLKVGQSWESITKMLDFSTFSTPLKETISEDTEEPEILTESQKHDKALLYAMAGHMKKMSEQFGKFPGVPPPLGEVTQESFKDSPFVDSIARAVIPKKHSAPIMELYRGLADPVEHVNQYKQKISTLSFDSDEQKEQCMCRFYGSTLAGPALAWLTNMPNGTFKGFADLVNAFCQQFACSRGLMKQSSDLFRIVLRPGEALRAYLNRFIAEMIAIPGCSVDTALDAFKSGVISN